jgi:CRP-like cAMP-binding protein
MTNSRVFGAHDPRQNLLFAALPADVCVSLMPHLELVQLPLGHVLYESGTPITHGYFPTTAIVSLLYVTEDGGSSEIAKIGNDGVAGISLFTGGESTPFRAIVQSAGYAYRLNSSVIKKAFCCDGPAQHLLLRYLQALLTQIAQTVVCNRHHSLDQQLCRCLLSILDRSPSNELAMTHELIAGMLGVRREGVTEAAGNLQKAGLIAYSRGRITVLNRAGLEGRSCECYLVVRNEFDRLIPRAVTGRSQSPATPATEKNSRHQSMAVSIEA